MIANASRPVAPNAVYVWRGFRSPSRTYEQFAAFLGGVFVPACALLQPRVGLRAYLPTMVPQANKPAAVPDQTALMFWATPAAHDLANRAIAVRIYQNLHGDAYDMARSRLPEVPVDILDAADSLVPEQPYFLLDRPADWMLGATRHVVAARRPDMPTAEFLAAARAWGAGIRKEPPAGVDGGLLCCGADYLVAWLHAESDAAALADAMAPLSRWATPVLERAPDPLTLPAGLFDDWPGLDLAQHACVNIQLDRPEGA